MYQMRGSVLKPRRFNDGRVAVVSVPVVSASAGGVDHLVAKAAALQGSTARPAPPWRPASASTARPRHAQADRPASAAAGHRGAPPSSRPGSARPVGGTAVPPTASSSPPPPPTRGNWVGSSQRSWVFAEKHSSLVGGLKASAPTDLQVSARRRREAQHRLVTAHGRAPRHRPPPAPPRILSVEPAKLHRAAPPLRKAHEAIAGEQRERNDWRGAHGVCARPASAGSRPLGCAAGSGACRPATAPYAAVEPPAGPESPLDVPESPQLRVAPSVVAAAVEDAYRNQHQTRLQQGKKHLEERLAQLRAARHDWVGASNQQTQYHLVPTVPQCVTSPRFSATCTPRSEPDAAGGGGESGGGESGGEGGGGGDGGGAASAGLGFTWESFAVTNGHVTAPRQPPPPPAGSYQAAVHQGGNGSLATHHGHGAHGAHSGFAPSLVGGVPVAPALLQGFASGHHATASQGHRAGLDFAPGSPGAVLGSPLRAPHDPPPAHRPAPRLDGARRQAGKARPTSAAVTRGGGGRVAALAAAVEAAAPMPWAADGGGGGGDDAPSPVRPAALRPAPESPGSVMRTSGAGGRIVEHGQAAPVVHGTSLASPRLGLQPRAAQLPPAAEGGDGGGGGGGEWGAVSPPPPEDVVGEVMVKVRLSDATEATVEVLVPVVPLEF